jgi:hypothetical protein
VDKKNLSQFGQTLQRLGIEMIPAYSPETRGRSERMFRTHQDRLPRELAPHGISDREAANRCLAQTCRAAFNAEFMRPAMEEAALSSDGAAGRSKTASANASSDGAGRTIA